jgi:hypothetical protein
MIATNTDRRRDESVLPLSEIASILSRAHPQVGSALIEVIDHGLHRFAINYRETFDRARNLLLMRQYEEAFTSLYFPYSSPGTTDHVVSLDVIRALGCLDNRFDAVRLAEAQDAAVRASLRARPGTARAIRSDLHAAGVVPLNEYTRRDLWRTALDRLPESIDHVSDLLRFNWLPSAQWAPHFTELVNNRLAATDATPEMVAILQSAELRLQSAGYAPRAGARNAVCGL